MKYTKILLFLLPVCVFPCFAKSRHKKVLPSHLQKAYVIQRDAIIYARPDFDALKITNIPAGSLVTVSKRLYRPKTNFGTFYRIYINKPKKMRAYVSEIDVVPRYIKKGISYKPNPEFPLVKKKLHRVRQFSANSEAEDRVSMSDKHIAQSRWVGMTVNHIWMNYAGRDSAIRSWFFNMKFMIPGWPVEGFLKDLNIGISFAEPVINEKKVKRGYIVKGDFLLKTVLVEGPRFVFAPGGGLMAQWISTRAPVKESQFQIGVAAVASAHFMFLINRYMSFSLEGRYYYKFHEHRFSPGIGGGDIGYFLIKAKLKREF